MPSPEPTVRIRVWDLPTRLFHWSLVALVACSWLTARYELIAWHLRSGACLVILLVFRLAWGWLGSSTARFGQFMASPLAALRYLRTLRRGQPVQHYAGHNPAGSWMVFALLAVLLLQVATGLCANDDLRAAAPLAEWVGKDWSDRLTLWHGALFRYLALLVWMHVLAAGFYYFVRGENLVGPMINGYKRATEVPRGAILRFAPLWRALLLLLPAAAIAGWLFRNA